jgi:hypothetical protein
MEQPASSASPSARSHTFRIEQRTQSTGLGGTPPEGILVSYGRLGIAQKDGVFIVIEASDPALVLTAAEALVSGQTIGSGR